LLHPHPHPHPACGFPAFLFSTAFAVPDYVSPSPVITPVLSYCFELYCISCWCSDSNLPSPYKPIDEVEMEADVAAAEAAAAAAADAGGWVLFVLRATQGLLHWVLLMAVQEVLVAAR
jgi:hypothetical protein